MAKSTKVTTHLRLDEVLKILLAGGDYEDIRQYAAVKGWKVSERQLRRYMQQAYERLADATQQNLKSLMGRHLMQRRGLYARALKANDIRTALMVLKDEAELQGLYPAVKIAASKAEEVYPHSYESGPPLSRKERFIKHLQAEATGDTEQLRLIEQVTPIATYRFQDILMPKTLLCTCALMHIAELLDHASMLFMATFEATRTPEKFDAWNFIAECHAYRYRIETDAWNIFTQELGVDGDWLVKANHRGSALELLGERICELAPTYERMVDLFESEGEDPQKLVTAKASAREWRDLINQAL
jgi:predicted DNA-binding protein (UPF0251 family)